MMDIHPSDTILFCRTPEIVSFSTGRFLDHNHRVTAIPTKSTIDELHRPSLAPGALPLNGCTPGLFEPDPAPAVVLGLKACALGAITTPLSPEANDTVVPEIVTAPPGVRI